MNLKSSNLKPSNPLLPVILGPTGVGKTKIAVEVASKLSAEIVSCDSRQVYQDMNIGTSKPSLEELKKVPHWLINIIPPDVSLNAWDYALLARKKIKEIWKRGKIPIVVGGSGLYLRALIDGFFRIPSSDRIVGTGFKSAPTDPTPELYKKLREIDPITTLKLHPQDRLRIIRALEVYELTGTAISVIKKQRVPFNCTPIYIGLTMPRDLLYRRIEERVDKMMEDGFLQEVKELLRKYTPVGTPDSIFQAIGYKELITHIQGKIGLEEAIRLIKRNTRRYAKRQFTWFKSPAIGEVHWIELPDDTAISKCIELILKFVKS